jgi:DNA invertase Pin-like site-specific DNA recombinase
VLRLAKRPAGAKVAALLESGVCDVVALKLDRLFRNAADALATTEEWHQAGISLHLVDMHGMALDTGSSMGKMFLTMLAAFAEFERNVISERTIAVLRHKRAHGEVYNHAPYGYDAVDGAAGPQYRGAEGPGADEGTALGNEAERQAHARLCVDRRGTQCRWHPE